MMGRRRLIGRRLTALVLGVALAMTLLSACGQGSYTVTATFDDVGDLQKSGSVQVADVRVGKISGISLTIAAARLSISRLHIRVRTLI